MTSSTQATSPSPTNNIKYDSDGYAIAFSSSEESSFSPSYSAAFGYGQVSKPSSSGPGSDKYASAFGYGQLSAPSGGSASSNKTATASEWATTPSRSDSDDDDNKTIIPPSFSKREVLSTEKQADKDFAGAEPEKSEIIKKREMAWICDNCGATNTPFDFLCWSCKAHHRCGDCETLVNDEILVPVFKKMY
ncbi:hypothetical protein QBC37DRAFT_478300 [Rhypophila decipiens]|uniref:RanBP2-type domain-containing protein n=1 Tax=Rhypophila decipiens TaxID=261697 RepID=A0AAN7BD52_9PEZI|nr:hypothetical protein QBC37DRAFT_478300 [Rhypophila decipiens]